MCKRYISLHYCIIPIVGRKYVLEYLRFSLIFSNFTRQNNINNDVLLIRIETMFYLLLILYLLPLGIIVGLLIRFAVWIVKKAVRLAVWLVRSILVLLGKALRRAFVCLLDSVRSRQTAAEKNGV